MHLAQKLGGAKLRQGIDCCMVNASMNMNYDSSEMINEGHVRLFKVPTTVFSFVFTVLNGHMIKRNHNLTHLPS